MEENKDKKEVEDSITKLGSTEIKSDGGMLTLTPHVHKTDGFFVAKMRRK